MAAARFDDLFFGILQNCEQIEPFLDVVFSFLARRTDFFRIMHNKTEKLGFPSGVAEKMVLTIFKKYQGLVLKSDERQSNRPTADSKSSKKETIAAGNSTTPATKENNSNDATVPLSIPAEVPSVISTVDVQTSTPGDSLKQPCKELQPGPGDISHQSTSQETAGPSGNIKSSSDIAEPSKTPECFNGAELENYTWSQTGSELEVRIPVPSTVKGKDVEVEIKNNALKVALKNTHKEGPKVFVEGELQWKIHAEESMWTLIRGEHIHITLDKVEDRWWTCVIKGDKEIDKSKIDTTRNISEFDEQTQCDYEKVMFDHRQKMMGKPTSEEMKTHEVLKKAWDAPNSPFAGTPFDPSKVNISGGFT